MVRVTVTAIGAALAIHGAGCASRARAPASPEVLLALDTRTARNVILLIGDGLGDAELAAARYYHAGAGGRLNLDRFVFNGACTTWAVDENDPERPDYVPDSASTATAWATGRKTSDRRLSTTAKTDQPLETILELAQRHGLRTGNVTTTDVTDATPAALAAHVNHRRCAGPQGMDLCPQYRKALGGRGSIAEQMIDRKIDVLLGGGRDTLSQTIDAGPHAGMTVIESAAALGYRIVYDARQLEEIDSLDGRPLLGLFAPGHLAPRWRGEAARPYPCSGPQRCVTDLRPAEQPTLAAMTRKALQLLEGRKGFFLQVEGGLIDKRAHAADPCGQLGETIDFDEAVGVALDYAAKNPDTLVIATADHAQSSQMVDFTDDENHPPGWCARLISGEGAELRLVYATNVRRDFQQHTGTPVRVAARGPRAARVLGLLEQTDLYFLMAGALGLIEAAR